MRKQNKTTILEYLNLDLKKVPDSINNNDDIDIKASEIRNEKNYKVYKYISIKDINIVMTNARRLDEPAKKIESMKDLSYYFNTKNEEEYKELLNIFQNASIEDIEDLEKFQKSIKTKIPSKIKYVKDYLWQIYYIERTKKYYMIVPLQETELQGFLYILKKKIENSKEKIYVPICNLEYTNTLIETAKIGTLENNLYFFTSKWPMIYEVYDNKNNISINIVGNLEIYENISSDYKMKFSEKGEINLFYELLKTLFYLQTELSNYFKFEIVLDETGKIKFYCDDMELTNSNLPDFYLSEIKRNLKNIEEVTKIQKALTKKLNGLKVQEKQLNLELLNKQKQISTFLECKKTFFGRVKYFFKYGKKKTQAIQTPAFDENVEQENTGTIKPLYTNDIEDLIYICKDLRTKTTVAATTRLDIQNASIKIDVLKKKIENATLYIEEIEAHKKSIFEFWKFTNKDEAKQLNEGIIEVHTNRKLKKAFNFDLDFEDLSKQMDKEQRTVFTKEETDSIFIATTNVLNDINCIIHKEKISEEHLLKIKEEMQENEKNTAFDIFGSIDSSNEQVKTLGNIKHRENAKNKFSILNLKGKTTLKEYTNKIRNIADDIQASIKKFKSDIEIPIYKVGNIEDGLNVFYINPESALKDAKSKEVNLYKIMLKENTNCIALTNIMYYNNNNQTLPLGMHISDGILINTEKLNLKLKNKDENYIIKTIEASPKIETLKINIFEYEIC